MISPMAWLCSLSRTMLPAMNSICSRIRFIPARVSSTDFLPVWEICTERCAPSSTDFAFWLATCAVCLTSSTVVVVSLTPVAVCAAPLAICVVVARISLAEVPSIPIPSCSSPSSEVRTISASFPQHVASEGTDTVRSPPISGPCRISEKRVMCGTCESRPISSADPQLRL